MPANSKFGCNFSLAKGAKQSFWFHLGFTPGNVSLQFVMNIIMPVAIQRRAFVLRRKQKICYIAGTGFLTWDSFSGEN
jgi:hypothetical protein